jgi:large subunit ribosomal protein L10
MPSKQNIESLKATTERLKDGKGLYFTDFTGLSVNNMEKLRIELKHNNGNFFVVKNTLGYLAMKELGFDEDTIKKLFAGPTGIAIAFEDPIILAKILTKHENLKIKGSFIEGKYFVTEEVIKFSKIPSKDTLYAQVVGSLNVLGSLVNTFDSILRNLIGTLSAMKEKEAK